jgi:quinol monooxygenase YgiN
MEEDMGGNVYWLLELGVVAGREDDLRGLKEEMINVTRDGEPGALNYEWHTSADGRLCHIYERYADSNAAMQHLASFGANFAERFLGVLKPKRFVVYGTPSAEVREALAGFAPVYMREAGGFTRQS